jgi:hypothetical protein
MALSKVILLVGAGATGTVVLRNSKVSEILNDVSQVHMHSLSLSLSPILVLLIACNIPGHHLSSKDCGTGCLAVDSW